MWSYEHNGFSVHQIPALRDNFIYLIATDEVLACVDPAEAAPVVAACRQLGRKLTHILNTHHHNDHTGGNLELKARYACMVAGAAHDALRIPGIDLHLSQGIDLRIGDLALQVLDIPGHTTGHIAFVCGEGDDTALFCGDTIFGAGCGRLFEGTPAQMWHSLEKLMRLPDSTRFYCAHEYTLNNLEFCLARISQSDAVKAYSTWCKDRLDKGIPSIPGTLGREKQCNPMLLPADEAFRINYAKLHGIGEDAVSVYTHIREARNHW
ncbi:MAG: hydroxyacylglutathione hydrolase [Zetaproteobacteria bacterium CG06_land_8_20_14_3_00_59_53]|nr:MAG: hydroxyacylglutathione hydrolase [Zetaproteobacteria bacterium CG2_30_59_37]PIO90872.1 MAG: hydroxyacylglutathione hydrolase [Zetaproteobacteria bacterium CG23_combo_of_CG06-09_8_20_14_all_59_86]PIQ64653.1 MAG: hydroxyacylglutathione hydrolase [Zetaproteobacteria bacterium CG11_big_fil_rev_8_21_14_0_20_59_439]PIU71182.1 MAG: hydroxyacylglutathione hydrolase [Zetaproteobacteria bacterium CG06_land_8_20_14_3_00_59_53]PIU96675.1 MAG: hydroxyacylglutathione hydrolase [Zetaproteobacteria bac